MNKIKFLLLCFCCVLFASMNGQESYGGTPFMFGEQEIIKLESIIKIEYPKIDNEEEHKRADEFAEKYGYGTGKFYGIDVPVKLDLKKEATVVDVDSGKVYLLELISPTAYALQVYFGAFKLPKGSRIFVYNSDRKVFLGSFTHENNFKNNKFWTEFIKGNSLIIEYYEPKEIDFEPELHIESLVHTFLRSGPFSSDTGGSAECNINVNCLSTISNLIDY